jgi:hypothetical protein
MATCWLSRDNTRHFCTLHGFWLSRDKQTAISLYVLTFGLRNIPTYNPDTKRWQDHDGHQIRFYPRTWHRTPGLRIKPGTGPFWVQLHLLA